MNKVRRFFCTPVANVQDVINSHKCIIKGQSDMPNFDNDRFFTGSFIKITYRPSFGTEPLLFKEEDFACRMRKSSLEQMCIYSDATGAMMGEPDQVISCQTESLPSSMKRVIAASSDEEGEEDGSSSDSDIEDIIIGDNPVSSYKPHIANPVVAVSSVSAKPGVVSSVSAKPGVVSSVSAKPGVVSSVSATPVVAVPELFSGLLNTKPANSFYSGQHNNPPVTVKPLVSSVLPSGSLQIVCQNLGVPLLPYLRADDLLPMSVLGSTIGTTSSIDTHENNSFQQGASTFENDNTFPQTHSNNLVNIGESSDDDEFDRLMGDTEMSQSQHAQLDNYDSLTTANINLIKKRKATDDDTISVMTAATENDEQDCDMSGLVTNMEVIIFSCDVFF
jgi:hypothetical protein